MIILGSVDEGDGGAVRREWEGVVVRGNGTAASWYIGGGLGRTRGHMVSVF